MAFKQIQQPIINLVHISYAFVCATFGAIAGYLFGIAFSGITAIVTGGPVTIAALSTNSFTLVFTFGLAALGFFGGYLSALEAETTTS